MSLLLAASAVLPPDPEEARRALFEELRRPEHARSWWSIAKGWFADRLRFGVGDTDLTWVFVLLAMGLVAALVLTLWMRRRRGGAAAPVTPAAFGADPTLGPEDHRERAAAHAARGEHGAAVVDYYRAITARAVLRHLVVDSPDLTAHEVGYTLAAAYPGQAHRSIRAGLVFDRVRYGNGHASRDDVALLESLEDDLSRADTAPVRVPVGRTAVPR